MRNIYFNASDIAALINKNPYKNSEDVIYDILCKINKEENKRELNKFNNISKNETINLLNNLHKSEEISTDNLNKFKEKLEKVKSDEENSRLNKELIEMISKDCVNAKNTDDCLKKQKSLEDKIKKNLKRSNEDIGDYLNGFINKKRGIKNEKQIIENFSKKNNVVIKENNSKLYKLKLFTKNENSFYICGKIDGIEDDTLIEIKNRKNRLFSFIPEYEKIQVEIYLRLTNMKKGKLIQNFNEEQSVFLLDSNEELWDMIINELNNVSDIILSRLD